MKRKKTLIVLTTVLILFVGSGIVYLSPLLSAYIHPLIQEFNSEKTVFKLVGICIGNGCFYSPYGKPGIVECRGYRWTLFCFSDSEKYCRYANPFELMEKCICESKIETEKYIEKFRKFCSRDGKCYTNSWEYEFGCAAEEDMEEVCKKAEEVFTLPDACSEWYDSAQAYGFVEKASECSLSWTQIYLSGNEERKRNIYNGFIEDGTHIKDLCAHICENCKSDLCNEGNICEYAV